MRIDAVVSPRFDLCYALAELASPTPMMDREWALPGGGAEPEWLAHAKLFGWSFWLAVPDVLAGLRPPETLDDLFQALRGVPPALARRRLVRGLYHSDGEPFPLSVRKREWLACIGLDDWQGENATGAALRREAAALMASALSVLDRFRPVFEPIWDSLGRQLHESRSRAERLARACDFQELARQLLLRVEVDEAASTARALRGGYAVRLDERTRVWLLPSAFNVRRFWSAADDQRPATLFFPYYDPSISFPDHAAEKARSLPAELDPWLVCRALGDPSRAAIVRRLAARPWTAAELGAALGLGKATVSHHIFQLREAGLIDEQPEGRSIRLSLRRQSLDRLSSALRRELTSSVP